MVPNPDFQKKPLCSFGRTNHTTRITSKPWIIDKPEPCNKRCLTVNLYILTPKNWNNTIFKSDDCYGE
jgi:hypothetical protein